MRLAYKAHRSELGNVGILGIMPLDIFHSRADTSADAFSHCMHNVIENPMGIEWFSLDFDKNTLFYKNAQGEKALRFAIGENVFSEFPEDGYFDMEVGKDGNCRYPIATSASWLEERLFAIKVQFIGKHLGGLYIRLGFTDDGRVGVSFKKTTNCFLDSYNGNAIGKIFN